MGRNNGATGPAIVTARSLCLGRLHLTSRNLPERTLNTAGADGAKNLKTATCPSSCAIRDTTMRNAKELSNAGTRRPATSVPHQPPAKSARGQGPPQASEHHCQGLSLGICSAWLHNGRFSGRQRIRTQYLVQETSAPNVPRRRQPRIECLARTYKGLGATVQREERRRSED
jgi:hypothetical protein